MRILSLVPVFILIASAAAAEPVYFLVDASRSMDATERDAAANQLASIQGALPAGTSTSTTVFGSAENGGGCGPVRIEKLRPKETDFLAFGTRGDHTPLGSALIGALRESESTNGRVVFLTDGRDTCGVDVCKIVRDFAALRPNFVAPEFVPIGASDDTIDEYGCLKGLSHSYSKASEAEPAEVSMPTWLIWALVGILFSTFLSVVLLISAMGTRANLLRKQIEALNDNKPLPKATFPDWFVYILSCAPLFVPTIILLNLYNTNQNALRLLGSSVWWFANQPFGAVAVPSAMLGFAGWALIQTWQVMVFRREKLDTESMIALENRRKEDRKEIEAAKIQAKESARLERQAKERAELLAIIEGQRTRAGEINNTWLHVQRTDVSQAEFEQAFQKMADIVDRLEASIGNRASNRQLARLLGERDRYVWLIASMRAQNLLGVEVSNELLGLFGDWERSRSAREIQLDLRARISNFRPDTIPLD